MSDLYIGLISGTSIDAVDAVLVEINEANELPKLLAVHSEPVSLDLKNAILSLCQPGYDEINRLGKLDNELGLLFAHASLNLLKTANIEPQRVRAIGSHGQTIRHHPYLPSSGQKPSFTLQIADPNVIAAVTGITTVADFRRRDMAHGGQGAPLLPIFHHQALRNPQCDRVIVNIGGIANISILRADEADTVVGYDTGPGNMLMDSWAYQHLQKAFDDQGQWAAQGCCHEELLQTCLADAYFQLAPPKSTGREYFNLIWLQTKLGSLKIAAADVQATLLELTARSIMLAISQHLSKPGEILICGGGAHNAQLMHSLQKQNAQHKVYSTVQCGLDPDWVEAIAFAWLAKRTLEGKPGNLPKVTGARRQTILGGIYPV